MKTCNTCGLEKQREDFGKLSARKDGLNSRCKKCQNEYVSKWKAENPERVKASAKRSTENNKKRIARWTAKNQAHILEYRKEYHSRNRKRILARNLKWRQENTEKNKLQKRRYYEDNKAAAIARASKYQMAKRKAIPAWANHFFIEQAYELAEMRTEMTGIKWHVDHIVPVQSDRVCGLHTDQNLQVIPAVENIRKSNRYWPDMQEEK